MKLVTFNINGIRARLPRLLEYLAREQPDVACLQELKCADEALPIGDIEAAGYSAVWHGQKGFNGVAILAKGKSPVLRQVGLPGDPDDTHSRYIEAEIPESGLGARHRPPNPPRAGWLGKGLLFGNNRPPPARLQSRRGPAARVPTAAADNGTDPT